MTLESVVAVQEFAVVSSDQSELRFKVEARRVGNELRPKFVCRLYRLEQFRFRASAMGEVDTVECDYRAWVIDDNFDLESQRFLSVSAALKHAVAVVENQTGHKRSKKSRQTPNNKKSTRKK